MAINKRLIKSNDEGGAGPSFNTVLYSGNSIINPITGVGFQPDFVWIKNRDNANSHFLTDSIRGAGKYLLSNATDAEDTTARFNSIDSDGFTVSTDTPLLNNSSYDYVAWCWKAGGAAVTNTDGTITSQVSANTEAGFSIVSYTGNGITGTIGHGLSSAPSMLIIKNRSSSTNWVVGSNEIGWNYSLNLNDTSAAGLSTNRFNSTSPTSSVFSVGATSVSNGSGNSMIAYCFAEVAGFSKFGSYTGNGGTQSISLGFEPAFLIIKPTSLADNWLMYDNKRGNDIALFANLSNADTSYVGRLTLDANGFTLSTSNEGWNQNGASYIYMAFADQF